MDASATNQQQHDELVASMSAQLDDLYADRERLVQATGLMSVDDVLVLIESMKAQLESLYAERDDSPVHV